MARDKGLIGIDFAEQCRQVGAALERDHRENFERRENEIAAEQARAADGNHQYYVRVVPTAHGVIVETHAVPLVGVLRASGHNQQKALTELRWSYACALVEQGLLPDHDTARAYARRAEFIPRLDVPRILTVVH